RVASTLDVFEDHASWDKAWEARSAHFRVVTTHSFGLAQDLASGLEVMLRHVQETLGVNRQPSRLLPVFVFGTIAEYNQFGTQNGQEHSSMYGSFYAQQHAERPVAAVFDQNPVFLRMQLTHSMVHEYLADAFPGHRLPVWADEGLAAYFSMFWDYPWGVAEFQRLKAAGKQPPLRQLLAEPIAAYPGSAHERFVTLAMLYYWLLLYRPDTATGPEQAPFRDYLLALLAGKDPTGLPITALLGSADALEQGLRDYQFPR
ncbi:MAG TPA: hypothetical protein VK348_11270, partial [Planctomycetota bacterium]|nr:hypothetical protein [Planctomycetota bacterium]